MCSNTPHFLNFFFSLSLRGGDWIGGVRANNGLGYSGECAEHFQALLKQFPPQTSSRDVASQWGCFVHNQVNERLKKEIFDCAKVSEHYKCGCADGGDGEKDKEKGEDGGELKAKEKEKAKLEKDSDEQGEEEDVKEAEEDAKKEVVNTPSWKSTKTLDENVEESRKHGAKIEVEKTG